MAQSVEHHLGKVEVPGSNPGNSSINKNTVIVKCTPKVRQNFWRCILHGKERTNIQKV